MQIPTYLLSRNALQRLLALVLDKVRSSDAFAEDIIFAMIVI